MTKLLSSFAFNLNMRRYNTARGECEELRASLHVVKMEMSREYLALEGEAGAYTRPLLIST
jgi:hypothetical protein